MKHLQEFKKTNNINDLINIIELAHDYATFDKLSDAINTKYQKKEINQQEWAKLHSYVMININYLDQLLESFEIDEEMEKY